jgi:Cu-Zn family superoxide dismutase
MSRVKWTALLAVVLAASTAAIALGAPRGGAPPAERAATQLIAANGAPLGTVRFVQSGRAVTVEVRGRGMPAGFHGFHVHAVGRCEGPAFTTAGGHLAAEGQAHGGHVGDLPSLYVRATGYGRLTVSTDRFTVAQVRGRAIIVHANADNFGNIPERYGAPDPDTQATGDSGGRIACGVIQ